MFCTITIDLFKKGLNKIVSIGNLSTPRIAESGSFRLWIFPRIRSRNQNGSKGSVKDSWGTDFCKNPRKSASLPCPFRMTAHKQIKQNIWSLFELNLTGFPRIFIRSSEMIYTFRNGRNFNGICNKICTWPTSDTYVPYSYIQKIVQ